jgi:hypothetical protein
MADYELGENRYGKSRIRLVTVRRDGDRHDLRDLTVDISLEGDFEAAHVSGDNANLVATDTMKNTVYALARDRLTGSPEAFGLELFADLAAVAHPANPAHEVDAQQHDGGGDEEGADETDPTGGDGLFVELGGRHLGGEGEDAGDHDVPWWSLAIPAKRSVSGMVLSMTDTASWKSSNGQAWRCMSFGQKKKKLSGATWLACERSASSRASRKSPTRTCVVARFGRSFIQPRTSVRRSRWGEPGSLASTNWYIASIRGALKMRS